MKLSKIFDDDEEGESQNNKYRYKPESPVLLLQFLNILYGGVDFINSIDGLIDGFLPGEFSKDFSHPHPYTQSKSKAILNYFPAGNLSFRCFS